MCAPSAPNLVLLFQLKMWCKYPFCQIGQGMYLITIGKVVKWDRDNKTYRKSQTQHFSILEPEKLSIKKFHVVQKRGLSKIVKCLVGREGKIRCSWDWFTMELFESNNAERITLSTELVLPAAEKGKTHTTSFDKLLVETTFHCPHPAHLFCPSMPAGIFSS